MLFFVFFQKTQRPWAIGCRGPHWGVCVKSKLTDPGQSKDYTISPLNSANPNKDLSVTTVN